MSFYKDDVVDSHLYVQSCLINSDLIHKNNIANMGLNRGNSIRNELNVQCKSIKDPMKEHFLLRPRFNAKYVCDEITQYSEPFTDDSLGYECNKGFMYELDEFNTYHNYPVCSLRDNNIACCPKNVQIFNNITKRNNEVPMHVRNDILLFKDNIPHLKYNTCQLY
jgi:hypothetical protein